MSMWTIKYGENLKAHRKQGASDSIEISGGDVDHLDEAEPMKHSLTPHFVIFYLVAISLEAMNRHLFQVLPTSDTFLGLLVSSVTLCMSIVLTRDVYLNKKTSMTKNHHINRSKTLRYTKQFWGFFLLYSAAYNLELVTKLFFPGHLGTFDKLYAYIACGFLSCACLTLLRDNHENSNMRSKLSVVGLFGLLIIHTWKTSMIRAGSLNSIQVPCISMEPTWLSQIKESCIKYDTETAKQEKFIIDIISQCGMDSLDPGKNPKSLWCHEAFGKYIKPREIASYHSNRVVSWCADTFPDTKFLAHITLHINTTVIGLNPDGTTRVQIKSFLSNETLPGYGTKGLAWN